VPKSFHESKKSQTPKTLPTQKYKLKDPPVSTPSPEITYKDSSTQFEDYLPQGFESALEQQSDEEQQGVPYLVPNDHIDELQRITRSYSGGIRK